MLLLRQLFKLLIFVVLYGSAFISLEKITNLLFDDTASFLSFFTIFLLVFLVSRRVRGKNIDRFMERSSKFSVVYVFMSWALSFYLVSLFFNSAKLEWESFVHDNPIYKGVLDAAFYRILIVLPAFAIVYPVWLVSRHKSTLFNVFVAFLYVSFWILVIYMFARNIFGLEDILKALMNALDFYYEMIAATLIVPLLKFIVGSLPLGWFYELFIGTIAPKEILKK